MENGRISRELDRMHERLEHHGEVLEDLRDKLSSVQVDIATLKVKSGIWGMFGGALPVALFVVIELIKK